jgi:TM2 domain-containing membrane protein YozV
MSDEKHVSKAASPRGINAMVMNLIIPGLGSIYGGKAGIGVAQLLLFLAGIPLCWYIIGFVMIPAAWLWSAITGFMMLSSSTES